ncbi:hypothetical protein BpHYR1_051519 [Brachionus plicatilis]|uniref:Uncharacterized protein n=1 Tax=Brachionus plicatilis TaxID=10195 RepID=A0A3M7R9Q2_BRAPC|nr:hypothetical protein BpHYR1_051519 [Brachionus plicatilis]
MAVKSRDESIIQETKNQKFWEINFTKLLIENGVLKLKFDTGESLIVIPKIYQLVLFGHYSAVIFSIIVVHVMFAKSLNIQLVNKTSTR